MMRPSCSGANGLALSLLLALGMAACGGSPAPGDAPGAGASDGLPGEPLEVAGAGNGAGEVSEASTGDAASPSPPPASPTRRPSPTPTPSATPEPPYAALSGALAGGRRIWGLQLALEFDAARQVDAQRLALPLAREAGMRAIRTTLRWDHIEPSNVGPGAYDWSESDRKLGDYSAAGFDLLVSLVAYPAWATEYQCGGALLPGMEAEWREFVGAVAERYSRAPYRVVAWEIGNEVDGETVVREDDRQRVADWGGNQPTTPYGGCWGGRAPAYAAFLRAASESIKAVHPEIPVTIGGLANEDINGWFDMQFLPRLLAVGGGEWFDFLGYHWFPDVRDAFAYLPDGPEKLRRLVAILDQAGQRKPIWLTESYRYSVAGQPASRARQIGYLSRELIEVLAAGDIQRVYWYGFVDFPAGYSENERGLIDAAFAPKPAYPVLRYAIDYSQGRAEDMSQGAVKAFQFTPPGGSGRTVIAWTSEGSAITLEIPAESDTPAYVTWFPPEELMAGRCCAETEVAPEGGFYRVELGSDARFVAIGRRR